MTTRPSGRIRVTKFTSFFFSHHLHRPHCPHTVLPPYRYVTHDLLELKGNLYKMYLDQCSSDPSGMQEHDPLGHEKASAAPAASSPDGVDGFPA